MRTTHTEYRMEYATTRAAGGDQLRRTTVNGRSEMLPTDPHKVAAILRARHNKSPGAKAKARLAAEAKKRGL